MRVPFLFPACPLAHVTDPVPGFPVPPDNIDKKVASIVLQDYVEAVMVDCRQECTK